MRKNLKIGDRVAYTAAFVRMMGLSAHIGDIRGTITGLGDFGQAQLVMFKKDDGEEIRALTVNLCKVGSVQFGDVHATPDRR